tara:strand:+ start:723 stop:1064 length:342 start_codon:yes stop_codon:yes gene_type:complete
MGMFVFVVTWLLVFSLWIMYIHERIRSTRTWWLSRDISNKSFPPKMSDAQYSKTLNFGKFGSSMKEVFVSQPYSQGANGKEKKRTNPEPIVATVIFGVTSMVIMFLYMNRKKN